MQHKTSLAIFDYWEQLCSGRDAPSRSEIDPAAIRAHLPDLFILEHGADGSIRFRLAGTRICLLLGKEVRDHIFDSLWSVESLHRARRVGEAVLASRLPSVMTISGRTDEGENVPLEMLLLPLKSKNGACDRIFGSLVALSADRTFSPPIVQLDIDDIIFLGPDIRGTILKNRIDPPAPTVVARSDASALGQMFNRIMHLRVFDGGRRD